MAQVRRERPFRRRSTTQRRSRSPACTVPCCRARLAGDVCCSNRANSWNCTFRVVSSPLWIPLQRGTLNRGGLTTCSSQFQINKCRRFGVSFKLSSQPGTHPESSVRPGHVSKMEMGDGGGGKVLCGKKNTCFVLTPGPTHVHMNATATVVVNNSPPEAWKIITTRAVVEVDEIW